MGPVGQGREAQILMTDKAATTLDADGFHSEDFNSARPFSGFLPGIAGAYGKPLWVFYANRGQCVASFGVGDKNGAMLEFHAANKAYTLTPLLGFRTFMRLDGVAPDPLYEPFQCPPAQATQQSLTVRPSEIAITDTNTALGLRTRVVYFTLAHENLPALVRRVTVENIGQNTVRAAVLDGLPQVVPFGLEEKLLKLMSRTMEAFAEVRHVEQQLPFFKLKVEPSDKPEVSWIHGGFFAFTLQHGAAVPLVADPDLVFGMDTSMRRPMAFLRDPTIAANSGRSETLTACAFAQLQLNLAPGASTGWDSYFGQAADWSAANALRDRVVADAHYTSRKRDENTRLIADLGAQFALLAGPKQLDAYTRQAFLDNTLRGGQPVRIEGPRGARVFHTFTRKHGDMERDYNFFELAPTYWSQGNGNFRDVNQNRRSENFTFAGVEASNIETFFELIQIDGNNPLVIQAEKFVVASQQLESLWALWHAGRTPAWQQRLVHPFSPGQLLDWLIADYGTPEAARPWFDHVVGHADKLQGALHGEGYWVDHWTYNLDLLDSFSALYPDRMAHLLLGRRDFSYFDNDHVVLPRDHKYVLRADGSVRQLHAVVQDTEKSALIAARTHDPQRMRADHGAGSIFRATLLAKIVGLLALKSTLFDPFGIGLEMEAEKPGWCDALNGLPGLIGSSTHEAFALHRGLVFTQACVAEHLAAGDKLELPVEVAELLRSVSSILGQADPQQFFATWEQLATRRESFRAQVRLGVCGAVTALDKIELAHFLSCVASTLDSGLAKAFSSDGLPVSYYTHTMTAYDRLPNSDAADKPVATHVRARAFTHKPINAFLEGAVHALRVSRDPARARALYSAVRGSALFDQKLGMYRVNAPLDDESFEIGRSRVFSPGWLENESIFLHMHYKFLLETLRSGLETEFFADLRRGLVAFMDPAIYGRSPLENSSFIASSRFPDQSAHGVGFVARLSGATAEWISMVLHMGLGAAPFRVVDGALRFEPRPTLADWLFTDAECTGFAAGSFGFKLFGSSWIVYDNPKRANTFGAKAVAPVSFSLHYHDGHTASHRGGWLPSVLASDVRDGKLSSLVIHLD